MPIPLNSDFHNNHYYYYSIPTALIIALVFLNYFAMTFGTQSRLRKEALEKINCPTLCIFGDLDKMVPLKVGNKMSELIKNSETKVINNCGHMIIFEKAFEMRNIVKEFILKIKK